VEEWSQAHSQVLSQGLGGPVGPKDFTDDRLEDLLKALGDLARHPWEPLEERLGKHLIYAYQLPTQTARLDTTRGSVYHQPPLERQASSLLQFGYSKDHRPDLRQFVELLGTLDPSGIPLITQTLSGNQADDGVYVPAWHRMVSVLGRSDFLLVADCKFASLDNRMRVQAQGGLYLAPLPETGERPELLRTWVLSPVHPPQALWPDGPPSPSSSEPEAPYRGLEVLRRIEGYDPQQGAWVCWEERWLGIQSRAHARQQIAGMLGRLQRAEAALAKLSQRPGKDRAALERNVQSLLTHPRVEDLLKVEILQEETVRRRYQGRGRPGPQTPFDEISERTFHLTFLRKEEALQEAQALAGWRLYVTNASSERLSLEEALKAYLGQWQPERGFARLKGRPLKAASIYLRDEVCIRGMLVILGLALRVLTLVEYGVRRELQAQGEELAGLYEGNPRRTTDRPTTERLLKVFEGMTWYRVETADQMVYQSTSLTPLQKKILALMGFSEEIYSPPSLSGG
jgi:transposase